MVLLRFQDKTAKESEMWYMYDVDVKVPAGTRPEEVFAERIVRIQVKACDNHEAYQTAKAMFPNARSIRLRGRREC